MPAKGPGGPPTVSPYVQTFDDYLGRVIRITVSFNTTSGLGTLTGITVFRDAGCMFTKILLGTGADGTPDSTPRAVNVPAGTTVLTQPQMDVLANRGLNTITDFVSYQITAGR